MKVLIVEEPYKDPQEYALTPRVFKYFDLDSADIQTMKEGRIVWKDMTAYYIEDKV